MGKKARKRSEPMEFLRQWRESLHLSRQAVANIIGTFCPDDDPIDQATIGKWESGETAVRVEDLTLLAKAYGTSADRLFFAPGDTKTPEMMERAFAVLSQAAPEAVENWLKLGESLKATPKPPSE